jgi:hypothetical protein
MGLLLFTFSAFSQDNDKQKGYYSELIKKNNSKKDSSVWRRRANNSSDYS